jgi:hypothetical protein
MGANLNLDLYRKAYFYFDLPVEYIIKDKSLFIYPVAVKDSEIFLSSASVLSIDKNASDSVGIIQMSYLAFIYNVLFQDEINISKFANILKYCLHVEKPYIGFDDNSRPYLKINDDISVGAKDFDNIRRIIMYQNLVHYDDEYINPEIKKMMDEVDAVKNAGIEPLTIERRMAIITAHCGISKQEQMNMTYRSHSLLFEEVYGEVEFETTRPILLYAGKGNEIDHWIFKKKKDKYDGYMTDADSYAQSMGSDRNAIKTASSTEQGDKLSQQYNNFVNK